VDIPVGVEGLQELNRAQERWNKQIQLLQQLNQRLLVEGFNDSFQSTLARTKGCLGELIEMAKDLPGKEPWGPQYADAWKGLRACLAHLEESLELLVKAKEKLHAHGMNAGWQRVLEASKR
jgi:hypothetical protein